MIWLLYISNIKSLETEVTLTEINLYSDTQTLPTVEMRNAMYSAEVGDDLSGEDNTVINLEEKAAAMLGKEAAMYVTSGTQGNLVAILSHCSKADEILVGSESHIFWNENASVSTIVGAQLRLIQNNDDGTLNLSQLQEGIRPLSSPQFPYTKLICLENTHNRCNGAAISLEHTNAVAEIAHKNDISLHVDGARIFNAAIALGIEAQELVQNADSITFCLSKGLSCPVGSVLCGSKDFIDEARRWRRMLGGGMRQAGVIAAAGVVGLEQMIDRLALDHATAKNLAYKISEIPGVIIDPSSIQTNIVIFEIDREVSPASDVVNGLKSKGVKVSTYGSIVPNGGQYIRMVTHRHIGEEDVDAAAMALSEVMASLS